MPALKELSVSILYSPNPNNPSEKLQPLAEYQGPNHGWLDKNSKQTTRWIEATAGQRFYIAIGPDRYSPVGAFPLLDVKTVQGGLKRLHQQGLIPNPDFNYFKADDAARDLRYIYLIRIFFDGNPQPAVCRVFDFDPEKPGKWKTIGYGDVRVNHSVKGFLPCTWQFQHLKSNQSAEDDLLGCFGQLGIKCTVDLQAAAQALPDVVDEDKNSAVDQTAGPGMISVQITRVVDHGDSHSQSSSVVGTPLDPNATVTRGLRSTAITATHKVETLNPGKDSKPYGIQTRTGLVGIDSISAPYLTFNFNYRDGGVLEKYGCKPKAYPSQTAPANSQRLKRGRRDDDDEESGTTVPTRNNAEVSESAASDQARKRKKVGQQIHRLQGRIIDRTLEALPTKFENTHLEPAPHVNESEAMLANVTTRTTQNSRNAAINGALYSGNVSLFAELRAEQAMQTDTVSTETYNPLFEYPTTVAKDLATTKVGPEIDAGRASFQGHIISAFDYSS